MTKYRVLTNCYGFLNRYWEKHEVVDLDESLNPPEHFLPIKEESAVEPAKAEPVQKEKPKQKK